MFKKHIQRYFRLYEGTHEIEMSKRLLELKQNEIIEYHNIFGAKVVKLKKFAVYFLLDKGREDVSSINFTIGKVKKSAFLNEIILNNVKVKRKWSTLEDLFRTFPDLTTYFAKQKDTYRYLAKQIHFGYVTTNAWDEIRKLRFHQDMGTRFEKTDSEQIKKEFNMHSIQAANIFFGIKKHGTIRPTQPIDVLDLNGLMTAKKFVAKVISTIDYLDTFFEREKIDFHFTLYVQSAERQAILLKSKDTIDKLIEREVSWEIVDLNLERTLFRNQTVLLNI